MLWKNDVPEVWLLDSTPPPADRLSSIFKADRHIILENFSRAHRFWWEQSNKRGKMDHSIHSIIHWNLFSVIFAAMRVNDCETIGSGTLTQWSGRSQTSEDIQTSNEIWSTSLVHFGRGPSRPTTRTTLKPTGKVKRLSGRKGVELPGLVTGAICAIVALGLCCVRRRQRTFNANEHFWIQ